MSSIEDLRARAQLRTTGSPTTGVGSERPVVDNSIPDGDAVKLMLFGQFGSGKTTLLASGVDDERTWPMVWADFEGGVKSFKSRANRIKDIRDLGNPKEGLIDVVRIKTWKEFEAYYSFLFDKRYSDMRLVYKANVMDSFTEINQAAIKYVLNDGVPVQRLEVDVPEQRDYLKANTLMKDIVRGFRDIEGLHCFYTALQATKPLNPKDPNSPNFIKPNLIGKTSDEACALIEYVGYLRAKADGRRELLFQPEGSIIAKEWSEFGKQIGTLTAESKMKPITMTQLMNAIQK